MNIANLLPFLQELNATFSSDALLEDNVPLMMPTIGDACHLSYMHGEESICPHLVLTLNGVTFAEHEKLEAMQFDILKELQELTERNFSERTNSDACSYKYQWDSTHRGYSLYVTIIITDYLS